MAKKILIVVAMLAAIFGLGFLIPSEQMVGRSVTINAPPEVIYAQLSGPQAWTWSPWERLRFEGPEAGVGAGMVWRDETMGEGRLWLTKADPTRGVSYEMSLNREPYTARGAVQLIPTDSSTLVVLTWKGRYSQPPARLMGFITGEKLGARFEQGLLALKRTAEASAPIRPPPPVAARAEADTAGAETDAPPESPEPAVAKPEPSAPAVAESDPAPPDTPEPIATPTQQ